MPSILCAIFNGYFSYLVMFVGRKLILDHPRTWQFKSIEFSMLEKSLLLFDARPLFARNARAIDFEMVSTAIHLK